MAYRRCLLIRGNLLDRKCHPSFSYVLHSDEGQRECPDEKSSSSVGIRNFVNGSMGFVGSSRDRMLSNRFLSPCSGYNFCRYMSTVNQGSDTIDVMTDVADVLTDTTMEAVASQAPIVNEVAIAAADSFLLVKVLQYVIDAVHSYTGLNWWAAIVLTTLLLRSATFSLLIYQLRATSKLTLKRTDMEEIMQLMLDQEGEKLFKKLFNEYGATIFMLLKGPFIHGSIFVSFFLAIRNMALKMPSFKHGGAYWFIDLTTPDALYIFPVVTALSFLITIEGQGQGLEGNHVAATMKNVLRGLAVLTVPLTIAMGFPKAIFCYLITSSLFTIVSGLVLKVPGVRKTLGLPALKRATSATNGPSSLPVEPSKHSNKKISSSVGQRLTSLEKQVKGRKKNKS